MDEYYKDLTVSVLQSGTAKLTEAEKYLKMAHLSIYMMKRIQRIINSTQNLTTEIRAMSNDDYEKN